MKNAIGMRSLMFIRIIRLGWRLSLFFQLRSTSFNQ